MSASNTDQTDSRLNDGVFIAAYAALMTGLIAAITPLLLDHERSWVQHFMEVSISAFILFFCRYHWTLTRQSKSNKKDRVRYNDLRSTLHGLRQDGTDTQWGLIYRKGLTAFLTQYSRWLGEDTSDAAHWDSPGDTISRPLFTWQSFDRCLMLSLLYPLASVLVLWAWFDSNGLAEQALGLPDTASDFDRRSSFGFMVLMDAALYLGLISSGWRSFVALVFAAVFAAVFVSTFAFADFGTSAGMGTVSTGAVAVAIAVFFTNAFAFAIAGFGAVTFAFAVAIAIAVADDVALAVIIALAVAIAIAINWIVKHSSVAAALFSLFILSTGVVATLFLGPTETWLLYGPLVLFFGVLVIVNVPIDWLSVGITRWLIWKGVDQRELAPLWWAFWDLIVAILLTGLLACAVWGSIELFNAFAVANGKSVFLDPRVIISGIRDPATRFDVEYWWIYLMLGWTLVPSWLNAVVSTLALGRGYGPINRWIGSRLPPHGAKFDAMTQIQLAAVLGGHLVLSTFLPLFFLGKLGEFVIKFVS